MGHHTKHSDNTTHLPICSIIFVCINVNLTLSFAHLRLANTIPTKAAAPPITRAVPPRMPSPIKPSMEIA